MMLKILICVAIVVIALVALGFVYYSGVYSPAVKAINKTVQILTREADNTDPNVINLFEKTIKREDLYFRQTGHTAATAPAIDSSSSVVNATASGQFTILDYQFVLLPGTAKVFTFTINSPNYPLTFAGSMQTSGTASTVNFSLIESEKYSTIARMSAGYTQLQKAIKSDIIKKYKFGDENYVDVSYSEIGPNSKDAPTFLAVFENAGGSAQTVTASLNLSYDRGGS